MLLRGVNDDEAVDLLRFAVAGGYELRFIEQMPLDAQHGWERTEMITAGEILERLRTGFELTPDPTERGGAPAERWIVDGGPAVVGVIASVTRPFCGACDRTRLTADGQVRNCLFARTETDLRALVRGGAADAEIADTWRDAMWAKLPGHGINEPRFPAAGPADERHRRLSHRAGHDADSDQPAPTGGPLDLWRLHRRIRSRRSS